MGQTSSTPEPPRQRVSGDRQAQINQVSTLPLRSNQTTTGAWDRFTDRCGRLLRRNRRHSSLAAISNSPRSSVARGGEEELALRRQRSAALVELNGLSSFSQRVSLPPVGASDLGGSSDLLDSLGPLDLVDPLDSSDYSGGFTSVPPPPPPQTRPPDPPMTFSSGTTAGSDYERPASPTSTDFDSNSLWTDIIGRRSSQRLDRPNGPLITPPGSADVAQSPLMRMSQVLAIVASLTASQLIGQRSDSLVDDHFFPLFNSLLEDVQNSEGGLAFGDSHSTGNLAEASRDGSDAGNDDDDDDEDGDDDDDDDDDDDVDDESFNTSSEGMGADEGQTGSAGPQRSRRGYFRMFRFPANDSGLVPVIIVSMRPADLESLSDFAHQTTIEAREVEGLQWNFPPVPGMASRPRGPQSARFSNTGDSEENTEENTRENFEEARDEAPDSSTLPAQETVQMSWIIYVWGGTYPQNHPIFMAPSLLTDNPTYEDMMYIQELMGPHKPPVASASELERLGGIFSVQAGSSLMTERCAICLTNYVQDDICRKLGCSHHYHQVCVDKWLCEGQNTCPLCRETGAPKEEEVSA